MIRFCKIAFCILLWIGAVHSRAWGGATYYVRPDGGSTVECTGAANAPYPGKGKGVACAFSHPFWALSVAGNSTKFSGGDTLIIKSGSYRMGFDAPNQTNTKNCARSYSWGCHMQPIPSGPDPRHPTRILGEGWDQGCPQPPELYGVERAQAVINLRGSSNVEIQCLDITDHDGCTAGQLPGRCNRWKVPYGAHAENGIMASSSSHVLLKNLKIHGFTAHGIQAGKIHDWTIEDTDIVANSLAGWDGDVGAFKSSNSGTIIFNRVRIQWNGCGETYPGRKPHNCFSQDLGGYGDGLGTHQTSGNWIFDHVDISHNTSDGLDLLYHDGTGTITIRNSRFEGNAGNQVKVATDVQIENSVLIGNCAYFHKNPVSYGVNNCRAMGNTFSANFNPGMKISLFNNTFLGQGDVLLETGGKNCAGRERVISRNNIFSGGREFHSPDDVSALFYNGGAGGNGDGPCAQVAFDNAYSVVSGVKGMDEICRQNHLVCADPQFAGPLGGDAWNVFLRPQSPAINKGTPLKEISSLDFSGYDRGPQWDVGAWEYRPDAGDTTASPVTLASADQGAIFSTSLETLAEEKTGETRDAIIELAISTQKVLRPVSPLIFGSNLSVKTEFRDEIIRFARETGITIFRFPAESSQGYNWTTGTIPTVPRYDHAPLAKMTNVAQFAKAGSSQLFIDVNMSSYSPEEAAQWVTAMNNDPKDHLISVTYWNLSLGNKLEEISGEEYAQRIKEFVAVMRRIDPKIKIGAEFRGPYQPETKNFDEALMKEAGEQLNFASYRWFPNQIAQVAPFLSTDEMLANTAGVDTLVRYFQDLAGKALGTPTADFPLALIEWDGGWSATTDDAATNVSPVFWSMANAIFYADALGKFARSGVLLANQNLFQDEKYGLIRGWDKKAGWGGSPWDGKVIRPKALAMQLVAQHLGNVLLDSRLTGVPQYPKAPEWGADSFSGETPFVDAYVSTVSGSQRLSIIFVNKHPQQNFRVRISLTDAVPLPQGMAWILQGSDMSAQNDGNAGTVKIEEFTMLGIKPVFVYTIPPHSVSAVELHIKENNDE